MKQKTPGAKFSKMLPQHEDDVRMLCFDIETRPALAYIWKIFDENIAIGQIDEAIEMISFAAKWVGHPEIEFRSVYHDGHDKMIERIWNLLDEADVVIHYNGKSFDVPHVQREFLRLEYLPPSPYQQIDLIHVCRKQFKFMSNKLAWVSEYLGLEGKIGHEGFNLWKRCMADDPQAWATMREYNVQDTILLEDLYNKIRPWITSHPSFGARIGGEVCSNCGSDHLQRRGLAYTKMSSFQRYQCQDCGTWMRSNKKIDGTKITSIQVN